MILARFARSLRRLRRDDEGLAAIELALFSPFLALLILGGYDVSRFVTTRANVDRIGFSVADVTSQYKELTADAMKEVFKIPGTVMPKYVSGTNGVTILTSVYLDASKVARVKWQCASSTPQTWVSKIGSEGQVAAVNAALLADDKDNLMVSEFYYTYSPLFSKFFKGDQLLYTASIYRPRLGTLTTKPC